MSHYYSAGQHLLRPPILIRLSPPSRLEKERERPREGGREGRESEVRKGEGEGEEGLREEKEKEGGRALFLAASGAPSHYTSRRW